MLGCIRSAIFGGLVIIAGRLLAQSSGVFVRTGDMTSARSWHTATLLLDGQVLLTGGLFSPDRHNTLAAAELYDPGTGTFVPTGSMKVARWQHAATRMADGRVLITGGYAGTEAEIYDPPTGTFATAGNMTASRGLHGATLLNSGKVLVTGGRPRFGIDPPPGNGGAAVASTEIFDPESGLFTSTADMTVARFNQKTTVLADGSVLIAPGSDGADSTTAEVYDSRNGSFRSLPFIAPYPALVAATSDLLPSGKVLLTLNYADCIMNTPNARVYDPATSTFSAAPNMNSNRCEQVSTPLADGNVLIGGTENDSTGTPPTAEIYDTQLDRFSVTGKVVSGRYRPRMTLLNNGKVLITGGGAEPSAELYEPAALAPLLRLLALPDSQPAILHADTHSLVSADNPSKAGEALEIYCTGLIAAGTIAPQVTIGSRIAEVLYFGGAPGFADLNQVNVRVPPRTESGSREVRLTYLDRSSNAVSLPVQ